MLTDLEAAAVGLIMKHQPCTAHFIRTCFRESLAKQFSDSKGSIYPMMKRLETRQILASKRQKQGQRFVRYYFVTTEGKASLRNWLGPGFIVGDIITPDPLRTRMLYLNRLPKPRRAKWFTDAEQTLSEKLVEIKMQLRRVDRSASDATYQELAIENAIATFKSRLQWLRNARIRLESEGLI